MADSMNQGSIYWVSLESEPDHVVSVSGPLIFGTSNVSTESPLVHKSRFHVPESTVEKGFLCPGIVAMQLQYRYSDPLRFGLLCIYVVG